MIVTIRKWWKKISHIQHYLWGIDLGGDIGRFGCMWIIGRPTHFSVYTLLYVVFTMCIILKNDSFTQDD